MAPVKGAKARVMRIIRFTFDLDADTGGRAPDNDANYDDLRKRIDATWADMQNKSGAITLCFLPEAEADADAEHLGYFSTEPLHWTLIEPRTAVQRLVALVRDGAVVMTTIQGHVAALWELLEKFRAVAKKDYWLITSYREQRRHIRLEIAEACAEHGTALDKIGGATREAVGYMHSCTWHGSESLSTLLRSRYNAILYDFITLDPPRSAFFDHFKELYVKSLAGSLPPPPKRKDAPLPVEPESEDPDWREDDEGSDDEGGEETTQPTADDRNAAASAGDKRDYAAGESQFVFHVKMMERAGQTGPAWVAQHAADLKDADVIAVIRRFLIVTRYNDADLTENETLTTYGKLLEAYRTTHDAGLIAFRGPESVPAPPLRDPEPEEEDEEDAPPPPPAEAGDLAPAKGRKGYVFAVGATGEETLKNLALFYWEENKSNRARLPEPWVRLAFASISQIADVEKKLLPGLPRVKWDQLAIDAGLDAGHVTRMANRAQVYDALKALMKARRVIEAHHPMNAQIHNTLQPLAGAYPAYYNVAHTKQDMSAAAPYAGDLLATYRKYCAFAGLPLVPSSTAAAAAEPKIPARPPTKPIGANAPPPQLVPTLIECGACKKKDKRERGHHVGAAIRERPPTKPLNAAALVGCHDEDEDRELVGCYTPPRKGTQKGPRSRVHNLSAPLSSGKALPDFNDIFK